MLTLNEIAGEQQWTFRSRLEDADDDRLHHLLRDAPGLRRLLPPLVSLDEGRQLIEGLLADRMRSRIEDERREKRRLARIAKAKLAKAKSAAAQPIARGAVNTPAVNTPAVNTPIVAPDATSEDARSIGPDQKARSIRWADMLYTFFGGK